MKDIVRMIIFLLIITVVCICIFKFAIRDQGGTTHNYSKADIIKLIKSEDNKNNYEVEYTMLDGTKCSKKYLDKKMKIHYSSSEINTFIYLDFEKDIETIVSPDNKLAVIKKGTSPVTENYIPEEILNIIEKPKCIIEKEERILNRNAIVLNYTDVTKASDQFLFTDEKSGNGDEEFEYSIKIWIDTKTGFLLQLVGKADDFEMKTIYDLKLNSVQEEDVAIPDLSQYSVKDLTIGQ